MPEKFKMSLENEPLMTLFKDAIFCIFNYDLEVVYLRIQKLWWKEMNPENGKLFCYLNIHIS